MNAKIPLPSPRWRRLDLRGINSNRKTYAVISPSRVFILSAQSIHVNLVEYFESDPKVIEDELFDVKWFCKFMDLLDQYDSTVAMLGVGEE